MVLTYYRNTVAIFVSKDFFLKKADDLFIILSTTLYKMIE